MNLIQIKYFQAVCMFGNVSEAAEYLHISQPSLSNAIKELEKEFGVTLFSRHYRGMALTEQGEKFRDMTKNIILQAERTEEIMRDMGQERKKLRLGVPPMIGSLILSDIYDSFLTLNNDVEIEITEAGSRELISQLNHNYIDMALISHGKPVESNFASREVSRFEIVCCVSQHNSISKLDKVTPELLREVPLILFENSFFQTEEIKKWFESAQIVPRILLQTGQLSTMINFISDNLAAGFMFRQLAEENTRLKIVPMENPIYANISISWKKRGYVSVGMTKFLEYINHENPFSNRI